MNYLLWFTYPYEKFLQPHAAELVLLMFGFSIAAAVLDLLLPAPARRRGRLTLILLPVNALLYQSQYLTSRESVDVYVVTAAAAIVVLYGLLYHRTLKEEWSSYTVVTNYWIGFVIIAVLTAVKLIELQTWPPFLNEYSANTGIWGIEAVEGQWPQFPFQGRGFDLRGGGVSPLMLPVMWLSMKAFGVNAYSVRFAEVVGSTLLLLIFWDFLRRNVPGAWSWIALTVFGMSPWHLAQSRMGTFFSISTAVSIGMLWSADRVFRSRKTGRATGWWILFGFFAGCIGWCYAPMKVLYLFFFAVVVGLPLFTRNKPKRWWQGPLLGLIACNIVFATQFQGLQNIQSMFQSHFGNLATDNPVWRKTIDDKVRTSAQPVSVILTNIRRNAIEWIRVTFHEPTILRIYPGALILSLALACLISRWHPVLSMYYFCGLLPPLLIFPLHRRSLILWPLVYLTAILIFREISIGGAALFRNRIAKRIFPSLVLMAILLIMTHGCYLWVTTWSIVKDHSYFGPARRLEAMQMASNLMSSHSVVFINPWVHIDVITITLYQRNQELGGQALHFTSMSEKSGNLSTLLDPYKPTAFFYFDLDNQAWLKPRLLRDLPGGVLQEFRNPKGRKELLFSVYTIPVQAPAIASPTI